MELPFWYDHFIKNEHCATGKVLQKADCESLDLLQILHTVSRKFYFSLKVGSASCDQIAECSMKFSVIHPERIARGIDGNQDSLGIGTAFKD